MTRALSPIATAGERAGTSGAKRPADYGWLGAGRILVRACQAQVRVSALGQYFVTHGI